MLGHYCGGVLAFDFFCLVVEGYIIILLCTPSTEKERKGIKKKRKKRVENPPPPPNTDSDPDCMHGQDRQPFWIPKERRDLVVWKESREIRRERKQMESLDASGALDPGDILYKTETLRRGNEDMRRRIAELRDTLQSERARLRDAHVDKVHSLKKQLDLSEVCLCEREIVYIWRRNEGEIQQKESSILSSFLLIYVCSKKSTPLWKNRRRSSWKKRYVVTGEDFGWWLCVWRGI